MNATALSDFTCFAGQCPEDTKLHQAAAALVGSETACKQFCFQTSEGCGAWIGLFVTNKVMCASVKCVDILFVELEPLHITVGDFHVKKNLRWLDDSEREPETKMLIPSRWTMPVGL